MIRDCEGCGEAFRPARAYHRLCGTCWRIRRDTEAASVAYQLGYDDGYQDGARGIDQEGARGIDVDLLRGAIRLTHPDAHPAERRELANKITAELLELLDEARFEARRAVAP